MSVISVVMMFLMKPCYYKKHEIAVLQEYEKRGICRDENHDSFCMQLPLNISPIRLFIHEFKKLLAQPFKKGERELNEHDRKVDFMVKKMERINRDNMDVVNIMKIEYNS